LREFQGCSKGNARLISGDRVLAYVLLAVNVSDRIALLTDQLDAQGTCLTQMFQCSGVILGQLTNGSCEDPEPGEHSTMTSTSTRVFSNVLYMCDVGANRISGDRVRTCGLEGWSGFPLDCQGMHTRFQID